MMKRFTIILIILFSVLLTIQTVPTQAAEHWTVAMATDPTLTLDPHSVYLGTGPRHVHTFIFECLWDWESVTRADGTVTFIERPELAETYEWVEPTRVRFHLRKGVKFHNGEDFTAEDVKYSLDFVKSHPKLYCHKFVFRAALEKAEVIDTYTVDLILKWPDPGLFEALQWMYIVPKSRGMTDEPPEEYRKRPAGTGFYRVLSWGPDEAIELEAWEGYRDGVMRPKRLTIKHISEPSTRLAALLAGEIDIMAAPEPAHLSIIRSKEDFDLATLKGGRMQNYKIQFLKPPFNDARVRKALMYAVDRKKIVDEILGGNGIVVPSYMYGPWEGAIPGLKPYPYNPEKAKQLLSEAGYPNGFEFDLYHGSGAFMKDVEIAEAAQAYWGNVGLRCKLHPTPRVTTIINSGEFNLTRFYWGLAAYSPMQPYQRALWWGHYEDKVSGGVVPDDVAQIRALIKQAAKELDATKRKTMHEKVNQMMYDSAIQFYSHAEDINTAYNKKKIGEWERVFLRGYADYACFFDYRGMYPR